MAPWSTSGTYQVGAACKDQSHAFSLGVMTHYAHCDMTTDGGKWVVIQRRINGSVDFYRNWTDYVNGFGDLDGEFWYGLDKIHCLTTREDVELRIELGNGTVPSIVWTYQLFKVGGADTNYRLTIGQAKGVGGGSDAMARHNGAAFSTRDRDHDSWRTSSCARVYGGAWWYEGCLNSNLNGKYVLHTPEGYSGSYTHGANKLCWNGGYKHYPKVQMKIRPKRCKTVKNSDTC